MKTSSGRRVGGLAMVLSFVTDFIVGHCCRWGWFERCVAVGVGVESARALAAQNRVRLVGNLEGLANRPSENADSFLAGVGHPSNGTLALRHCVDHSPSQCHQTGPTAVGWWLMIWLLEGGGHVWAPAAKGVATDRCCSPSQTRRPVVPTPALPHELTGVASGESGCGASTKRHPRIPRRR
jgi:hypothetical protein